MFVRTGSVFDPIRRNESEPAGLGWGQADSRSPFPLAITERLKAKLVSDHIEIVERSGKGLEGLNAFEPCLELPVDVLRHDVCSWNMMVDGVSGELIAIGRKKIDNVCALCLVPSFDYRQPSRDATVSILFEHAADIGNHFFSRFILILESCQV